MKVVYIAGPFRSMNANGKSNAWGVQNNVMRAMACALEVWKLGHAALCPHSNTMFFQDADGCVDSVWLEGYLELLRRSDAMLLTPDWEKSSGARAEYEFARKLGLKVFYDVKTLKEWLWVEEHSYRGASCDESAPNAENVKPSSSAHTDGSSETNTITSVDSASARS